MLANVSNDLETLLIAPCLHPPPVPLPLKNEGEHLVIRGRRMLATLVSIQMKLSEFSYREGPSRRNHGHGPHLFDEQGSRQAGPWNE